MDENQEFQSTLIAYKGFSPDWTCNEFQYQVGRAYTHEGEIKLRGSGFHACEAPLDVWNYYGILGGNQYAKVELSGLSEEKQKDTKRVAKSIFVKASMSITDLIRAQVEWAIEKAKAIDKNAGSSSTAAASGEYSSAASSGEYSKGAASGDYSTAAAAGDSSMAAASGSSSKAAASGEYSAAASSAGGFSTAAASGESSTAAASGVYGTSAASGSSSMAASSGYSSSAAAWGSASKAAASGDSSKVAASGDYSKGAASGDSSSAASSGESSSAASSGSSSTAASSGRYGAAASAGHSSKAAASGRSGTAAASGDYSKAECATNGFAFVAGLNGAARGSVGSAFALGYRDSKGQNRIASGIIGENGVRPDTWYRADKFGHLIEL